MVVQIQRYPVFIKLTVLRLDSCVMMEVCRRGFVPDHADDLKKRDGWGMDGKSSDCEVGVRVPHAVGNGASALIRVSLWHCGPGRVVHEGQRLVELSIGPVSFTVHAPCDGRLIRRLAAEDDLVQAGDLLGVIKTDGHDSRAES